MARMGLTPEKVVAAAADLADRVGIGGLSLSALANNLGVRVPSLYKHVRSLDDLQHRLAAAGADGLAGAVEAAVAGKHGRPALTAIAVAYRAYAHDNRGSYQAMVLVGAGDGAHPDLFKRVDTVLRAVMVDYGLAPDEARDAAQTVLSALHGFVLLEADGSVGADPDRSLLRMVGMLDGGITSAGHHRPRFRLAGRGASGR